MIEAELEALRLVAGAFICTTLIATILWLRARAQLNRQPRRSYGRTQI